MNASTNLKFNPHQDPRLSQSSAESSPANKDIHRTAPWQSRQVLYPGPNEALIHTIPPMTAYAVAPMIHEVTPIHGTYTLTGQESALPFNTPVVVPSRNYIVEELFQILQRWEGVVLKILPETFIARLSDRTDPARNDEEAEFLRSDISESDLHLLEEGAIFYWSVGYRNTLDGNRQRLSEIRFRRLPAWNKTDIEQTKKDVQHLKTILG